MDLEEIKNLIKLDRGKFIIVEKGEPVLMIMSFRDYQKLIGYPNREVKKEEVEKFNSENESHYSEEVEQGEALNIEDLPV